MVWLQASPAEQLKPSPVREDLPDCALSVNRGEAETKLDPQAVWA
jgi:hypothetical protein